MILTTGLRCGCAITHRTDSYDMPLCKEHSVAIKKDGATCFVSEEHFVGIHKATDIKRATPSSEGK